MKKKSITYIQFTTLSVYSKWKTIAFCIMFVVVLLSAFSVTWLFCPSIFYNILSSCHLSLSLSIALALGFWLLTFFHVVFTCCVLTRCRREWASKRDCVTDWATNDRWYWCWGHRQSMHCNGMRYGLIIVRRFPTFGRNFPFSLAVGAVAMPMQMENESKWYMYSLCIVCVWTLRATAAAAAMMTAAGAAYTSQTSNTQRTIYSWYTIATVVHSCHW